MAGLWRLALIAGVLAALGFVSFGRQAAAEPQPAGVPVVSAPAAPAVERSVTVPAGPTPVIPEAPLPVLLPLSAVALVAGLLLIRHTKEGKENGR